MYVYVCMYICTVCTCVCMYVRMYECTCMYVCMYVCMYGCTYVHVIVSTVYGICTAGGLHMYFRGRSRRKYMKARGRYNPRHCINYDTADLYPHFLGFQGSYCHCQM